MFFGAGNLILPAFLGFLNSDNWMMVCFAFCLSAVVLPMMGIIAHGHTQGGITEFARPISKKGSVLFSILIYIIAITLPAPRTAAVVHEIAIVPYISSPEWVTSLIFFSLIFLFTIRRSRLLNDIGKWLTPILVVTLFAIVISCVIAIHDTPMRYAAGIWEGQDNPFSIGLIEGFQTFDGIGALVVGAVVVRSLKLDKIKDYHTMRSTFHSSAFIAGSLLIFIYTLLMYTGAIQMGHLPADYSRTDLLRGIAQFGLGEYGQLFLAILVSVACFTTAASIVTGTADFVSKYLNLKYGYELIIFVSCLLGVLIGQFPVDTIIQVAIPIIVFIYPVVITLIVLNFIAPHSKPEFGHLRYKASYRWTVGAAILFSLGDTLSAFGISNEFTQWFELLPLASWGIGWMLPTLMVGLIVRLYRVYTTDRKAIKNS